MPGVGADGPRPHTSRAVLLHLALVVLLTLAFASLAAAGRGEADADIGAGLAVLPLLVPLGLPWSILYLSNPYAFDDVSTPLRLLVLLGPAYLNVLLHALWRRRRH